MFGFTKNKKKTDKQSGSSKKGPEASVQGKSVQGTKEGSQTSLRDKGSQSLAGDALRAQALANARMARQNIGEETLDRIAAAMAKKQQSAIEQAKLKIQNADADRVAAEILSMLETRH